MRKPALVLAALATCAVVLAAVGLAAPRAVDACAFDPWRPNAYEADAGRTRYTTAIDAAAVNRLLPGDTFFALPPTRTGVRTQRVNGAPYIPPVLLKAIGWIESNLTMASRSVPYDAVGTALITFDCGHGIMQVTTGMTVPLGANNNASDRQASIATHFAYNIARGAQILSEKWNAAPEQRPIAGTDTNSDPQIVENWYFAVWAYNGFTGPGSSQSNHPLDASFARWPRPAFRCDAAQSRAGYPYQELVWGCMAQPASRDGRVMWQAVPATLPDLTQPQFFNALSVANWTFPYAKMDMPTPQPAHVIPPPQIGPEVAQSLLGAPVFQVSTQRVSLNLDEAGGAARATVRVRNAGTGLLTWTASTTDRFLVLSPPAGVAVGSDVKCTSGPCQESELVITINPSLLPDARATGRVRLVAPNTNAAPVDITIDINAAFAIGAPGTSRAP